MKENKESTRFHWPVNVNKRLSNRVWYALFSVLYILAVFVAPVITCVCLSGVFSATNYSFYLAIIIGLTITAVVLKAVELYLDKLDVHYKHYRVFLQIYKLIIALIIPALVIVICLMLHNCVEIATDRLLLIVEISCGCIMFGGVIKCIFIDELKMFFLSLNLADRLDNANYINNRINH